MNLIIGGIVFFLVYKYAKGQAVRVTGDGNPSPGNTTPTSSQQRQAGHRTDSESEMVFTEEEALAAEAKAAGKTVQPDNFWGNLWDRVA